MIDHNESNTMRVILYNFFDRIDKQFGNFFETTPHSYSLISRRKLFFYPRCFPPSPTPPTTPHVFHRIGVLLLIARIFFFFFFFFFSSLSPIRRAELRHVGRNRKCTLLSLSNLSCPKIASKNFIERKLVRIRNDCVRGFFGIAAKLYSLRRRRHFRASSGSSLS